MNKILLLVTSLLFLSCSAQVKQGNEHNLILISFDGFRADYLSKTETPNFDYLAKLGVTSDGLIPVFPSKTFPNHYALVTGLYPENNGLVSNSMYDPEMDIKYSIGNREQVENPDWYKGEPIWNTAEKQGKKAGTMFWVGSEAPIQNMRPSFWKSYDGSVPDSARIDLVVEWMTLPNNKKIDLATLYFSFLDSQGHRFGPDSPEVVEAIKHADDLVGYLIEQLKNNNLWDTTNIIIVSDHGMSELSRERIIVLDDYLNIEDIDIISGSPAVMMNTKNGKLEEIYSSLKRNENHFKVYKKEEIPERFHLKNSKRIPELLVIADRGYTINTKSYFDRNTSSPSGGTHGFDNQDKEMWALFLAEGPAFKKDVRIEAFENIHLYELMAKIMNLEPAKNDGNLNEISEILN